MNASAIFDRSEPDLNSGCWLWAGRHAPNGYGTFGRCEYAHRASWKAHSGPIPTGVMVLHKCDTRCCVNPDHLFLGDAGDNIRDATAKGRQRNQNTGRTHCKAGHPLSGANLKIDPTGFRRCRACRREYLTRYRRQKGGAS